MVVYTGIVSLPPSKNVPTFNNTNYIAGQQGLTYGDALKSFLAFPQAQGKETLLETDVTGLLQVFGDVSIIGTGNYLQFPDGTQQLTAVDPADYATLNDSNTFLSLPSPAAPYQQIITGNSLSGNTNAPLVVKNIDNNEYFGWYIDPSSNFDTTLYSNQSGGGLTIRNVDGNSFSVSPSAPNNTALFSNPISCGTFPLNAGAITGTQLTLTNGANTSLLTTTTNGLNVADPIVATGNITSTSFIINDTVNDVYQFYSQKSPNYGMVLANTTSGGLGTLSLSNGGSSVSTITCTAANALSLGASSLTTTGIITGDSFKINSPGDDLFTIESLGNFGLLISDTTGNNGKITLSNNGSVYASMTCSAQNEFTFSGSTIVSSQTYPLTSSNQTATISYVNQAIAGQGSGDASLSANQTFTGINTFSSTAQTSTLQTFPQLSTNQFATYAYVNNIGESSGFNFLKLTCPQLTGSFTITYQSQGGPLNDSGQVKYNVNTSVNGSVYTYLETWRYCYVSQSNLSPINNCIFTLSFSTGTTPVSSSENVSIRVVNGGTQYTLPCVLINSNTQFQTTTPLNIVSGQSYAFYLQGSYI